MSQIQDNSIQITKVEDPTPLSDSISLWHNRDFLLLWSGQFISSIGTQVTQLAFPLLILAITFSPAQAGLVGALRGLPFALLCLPAGALVDRLNRKRVMIICDAGRAIALGSIPIALATGHLTFLQLCLVAVVEGTLFTFFNLAEAACLPRVVTKEQLPTASAQFMVIDSTSWMLGPALGGILYGLGRSIPFLTDAISYAVSFFSLFFIKARFQQERPAKREGVKRALLGQLLADISEGMLWLWRYPLLRFIALLTCGLTAPCMGFGLILILLAQRQHASAFIIGLIFASSGVGSIIGSLVIVPLQKRFSFPRLILITTWIWALSWLSLAIAPNPLVLGIVNGISFIVVPMYNVVQYSFRLAVTPDQLQGRINSIFRLVTYGSVPLGLTVTGLLLQAIGPVFTVVVLFIPQFVLAIAATFSNTLRAGDKVILPRQD